MSRSWFDKAASLASAAFQMYSDHPLKRRLRKSRNFHGRCSFLDHKKDSSRLLLVVAGHKPRLWPLIFPRIERFAPRDWDVCFCCPGANPQALRDLAAKRGWSFLSTRKNQLALAQNLAIQAHRHAQTIIKMDEDIFLADGTLEGLVGALAHTESSGPFFPGVMAPLLNVNGYSSRTLLQKLGHLAEFESRFGPCKQSCLDTPPWRDPAAAQFLWEILLPFDESARKLTADTPGFSACPHRFSIGCFAIRRAFWEAMQGFTVAPPGDLGVEEIDLAAFCTVSSRPIVVAHHLLVGHAGFGHQMAVMEPWLIENAKTLKI